MPLLANLIGGGQSSMRLGARVCLASFKKVDLFKIAVATTLLWSQTNYDYQKNT